MSDRDENEKSSTVLRSGKKIPKKDSERKSKEGKRVEDSPGDSTGGDPLSGTPGRKKSGPDAPEMTIPDTVSEPSIQEKGKPKRDTEQEEECDLNVPATESKIDEEDQNVKDKGIRAGKDKGNLESAKENAPQENSATSSGSQQDCTRDNASIEQEWFRIRKEWKELEKRKIEILKSMESLKLKQQEDGEPEDRDIVPGDMHMPGLHEIEVPRMKEETIEELKESVQEDMNRRDWRNERSLRLLPGMLS